MLRRLVLVALLLPLFAVAVPAYARSKTVYTPETLANLLLNQSDVALALSSTTSALSFNAPTDTPPSTDPVAVGRTFTANDGSLLGTFLYAQADGSTPSGNLRDSILNGDFIRTNASGLFTAISGFATGPSFFVPGQDISAQFSASANGVSYNIVADAFLHGNIFGVVFYATPGTNNGLIMAAALGGQLAKLP